jgi:hypothetical protein
MNQKTFDNVDAGDLTKQFEKKKSLNCKPIKYYFEDVATEFFKRYPLEPQQFAAGKVKSEAVSMCLGLPNCNYLEPIELVDCNKTCGVDLILTFEKSIKLNDTNDQCLDGDKWISCLNRLN